MADGTQTLTLVFVDVPTSSVARAEPGQEVANARLAELVGTIETVFTEEQGTVVRVVGSTMLCTFETPEAALRAACRLQRTVSSETPDAPGTIGIRIALHTAPVVMRDGSCTGPAVSLSARVVTCGQVGQILLTGATEALLPDDRDVEIVPLPGSGDAAQRLGAALWLVRWDADPPAKADAGGGKDVTAPLKLRLTPPGQAETVDRPRVALSAPPQPTPPEGTPSPPSPGSGPRLTLICHGSIFVVDASQPHLTLGREFGNTILLAIDTSSRRHAEVTCREGTFWLVDHSWNGTYVYDKDGIETVVHDSECQLSGNGVICPGCPGDLKGVEAIRFVAVDA